MLAEEGVRSLKNSYLVLVLVSAPLVPRQPGLKLCHLLPYD